MVLTRSQKIAFYRNKKKIAEVIIDHVKKKKHIIFGSRSLNAHFPKFLDKATVDYDILVEKGDTRKVARRIEKKLDKKLGGNHYVVEKGRSPNTYRVKRILGKEVIVDVTKSKKKVSTDKIRGVRYSSLQFEKEKIKESLGDPKSMFRHDKDRERLERIKIFESLKKKTPLRRRTNKRIRVKKLPRKSPRSRIKTFPINFKLKTRLDF